MMNVPYEEVIKLIQEKSSLSEDEINKKIQEKLDQLSGLISKEGAAHILANDLGINFSDVEKKLKINKVLAGMRNVETIGKVLQKYEIREFNSNGREGKVANFLMGDETGVMRVVLWNNQADLLNTLQEGSIVKIASAYARSNNNRVELHLNDQSTVEVNPPGESLDNVKAPGADVSRKKVSELNEQDSNVELLGTIVQVFEPRFFEVDPQSGRRIRPSADGKYYNQEGAEVTPDFSYVFNIFLDDGTDNIRVVCFRNQMQALLNKEHDAILTFKDNTQLFEPTKHELLGQMVKVQGRVTRNDMFDRLEFVANRVYMNPSANEELKNVQTEKQEVQQPVQEPTPQSVQEVKPEPTPQPVQEQTLQQPEEETSQDVPELQSADTLDQPRPKQQEDVEELDDLGELEELDDLDDDL
jgi:hypothetical protein